MVEWLNGRCRDTSAYLYICLLITQVYSKTILRIPAPAVKTVNVPRGTSGIFRMGVEKSHKKQPNDSSGTVNGYAVF